MDREQRNMNRLMFHQERGRMMMERGALRVSPMNDNLRVRNINGQKFTANASYTYKSKEFAQRMAEASRRKTGRNVRTIKTANGWLNYVSPKDTTEQRFDGDNSMIHVWDLILQHWSPFCNNNQNTIRISPGNKI